jgi:hypothetical protein
MAVQRDARGRIVRGALNPAGRAAGSRSHAAILAQQLIGEHAEELVTKAVAMAMAGDSAIMRALLDRLVPPMKERALDLGALPELQRGSDATEAARVAFGLLAEGQLTVSELTAITKVLAALHGPISAERSDRFLDDMEAN